ncbi:MAG: hypothetical protein RL017_254 [Pseudomonadota bacterium]
MQKNKYLLLFNIILIGSSYGLNSDISQSPIQFNYANLYNFAGFSDGNEPFASLLYGKDGNLYGTTQFGGINNLGTVFMITPDGKKTILYSFNGAYDGNTPQGKLTQDSSGNLYGTTLYGGVMSAGTVFEVSPNGKERVLYSFKNGSDGANPTAGVTLDSSGNLYGTTKNGGNYDYGTVFKIDQQGNEELLYSFTGNNDGYFPVSDLIFASDGNLYGTTMLGGNLNCNSGLGCGTVFKITPQGLETVVYNFQGNSDGSVPMSGVILAKDGNLYGTTEFGGTANCGTVYKINTHSNGVENVLYSFNGTSNGNSPYSKLIQGYDGSLYGTTEYGGVANSGLIFQVTLNGVEKNLYKFQTTNDGNSPYMGLAQDDSGNLYGTTEFGGMDNNGTIFKLSLAKK